MKPLFRFVVSLCLILVAFVPASAQITLTAADVSAILAPGRVTTSSTDTARKTADIGVLGLTSWNFATLTTNFPPSTFTSVLPATTPFSSFFPGSTNAQQGTVAGSTIYNYMKLGTNLLFQGIALAGYFQERTRNLPEENVYQLPMTLGTSWTSTYAESTIVMLPSPIPPQITVTDYTVMNTVDAYGDLTLPGGGVYQALRLRTDRRSTSASGLIRTISYSMLARNGAAVTVLAADTTQPNSGTINVVSVSWTDPVVSDVHLSSAISADFVLLQNYPNPFNPSTIIRYSLPSRSYVTLTVYNTLGQQIETLVQGEKEAGYHEVKFEGSGLSSGVYFYRLTAGDYVATKKLLLIR